MDEKELQLEIRKWSQELRTTNKKQGQNHLKTVKAGESYYCCKGIHCELLGEAEGIQDRAFPNTIDQPKTYQIESEIERFGRKLFPPQGGDFHFLFGGNQVYFTFHIFNDILKMSFQEIADILDILDVELEDEHED